MSAALRLMDLLVTTNAPVAARTTVTPRLTLLYNLTEERVVYHDGHD
jgi:hypothetical protein